VQVFHDQVTSLPVATVLLEGVNALFVTEMPPAGVGVLPVGGWFGGAVEPPLPPHAPAEISASAIQTFLVFMMLSPFRIYSSAHHERDSTPSNPHDELERVDSAECLTLGACTTQIKLLTGFSGGRLNYHGESMGHDVLGEHRSRIWRLKDASGSRYSVMNFRLVFVPG
jgi:hypothetical protein